MKILIVAEAFHGSTISLVESLMEYHKVDVCFTTYCSTDIRNLEALSIKSNIRPFVLSPVTKDTSIGIGGLDKEKAHIYFLRSILSSKFPKRIVSSITRRFLVHKARKYDFVIVIGQGEFFAQLSIVLQKQGIPNFHTLHEIYMPGTQMVSDHIQKMINANVPILLHSKYVYHVLSHEFPAFKKNFYEVPFGVFKGFLEFNRNKAEIVNLIGKYPYILNYGYLVDYKGYDILWEVYKLMKSRNQLHFKIVVAGSGHNKYVDMMKRNPDFVVINKWLDNDDIATLISHSEQVICPYKRASQSGIPQTSFCFGKPVVATDVGAFREVIVDGYNGWICKNAEDMADKILDIISHKKSFTSHFRDNYGLSSIYDWKNIASKYNEIFNILMRK